MSAHEKGFGMTEAEWNSLKFGDWVENGWASERNPTRKGMFVRHGKRTGKLNPGKYIEVTDGAGKFWELPYDLRHKLRDLATLDTGEAPVAWADPRAIEGLFGTPAKRVYLTKNGEFAAAYSMALYSAEQMAAKDAHIAALQAKVAHLEAYAKHERSLGAEAPAAALNDIMQALEEGEPFAFDPATGFIHAIDGDTPSHFVRYLPADEAEAAKAELLEGLKPFAEEAEEWPDRSDDTCIYRLTDVEWGEPTVGDLRRARTLIEKHGGGK